MGRMRSTSGEVDEGPGGKGGKDKGKEPVSSQKEQVSSRPFRQPSSSTTALTASTRTLHLAG